MLLPTSLARSNKRRIDKKLRKALLKRAFVPGAIPVAQVSKNSNNPALPPLQQDSGQAHLPLKLFARVHKELLLLGRK